MIYYHRLIFNYHFTSHIVQIKPHLTLHHQEKQPHLYIPHSSDKTFISNSSSSSSSIFTSHIVQIKPPNRRQPFPKGYLYIPHSSDKTLRLGLDIGWRVVFTSHIVQIKLGAQGTYTLRTPDFTSHIVQIKHLTNVHQTQPENLYIPHSSDKTHAVLLQQAGKMNFTSHIVQIKLHQKALHRFHVVSLHPT